MALKIYKQLNSSNDFINILNKMDVIDKYNKIKK